MSTRRTTVNISVICDAVKAPNSDVWEMGTGKKWICWTPNHLDYFSYNTCIATLITTKTGAIVGVVFNKTPYSATTKRYQQMLIEMFTNEGLKIFYVDGLGFNVTPKDLLLVHNGDLDAADAGTMLRKQTRYTGGGYMLKERRRSTLI
jgi:hypothetical protein